MVTNVTTVSAARILTACEGDDIDGLEQNYSNSIANALPSILSFLETKPQNLKRFHVGEWYEIHTHSCVS